MPPVTRRALLLAGCLAVGRAVSSAPPAYRLIVHPGNPADSLDRKHLADVFLKKVGQWPDGVAAQPVDLPADAPARRRFSEEVLGRSVAAVKSYWQQLIFSGRGVPPPELESDDEVVRFVASHRGGVGYVSGSAGASAVKVVSLR
jgi:hypothetical protein